jgi:hypothetical protein
MLYDKPPQRKAERMFDDWRIKHASSIPEFEDAAATVQEWRKEIFHFFDYPFTNAYTEYRNKLIRALNGAGNGYTFPILRAKAMRMRNLGGDFTMCEMCLGQFEADAVETVSYPVPGRESIGVSNKCPACRELSGFPVLRV